MGSTFDKVQTMTLEQTEIMQPVGSNSINNLKGVNTEYLQITDSNFFYYDGWARKRFKTLMASGFATKRTMTKAP